MRSRTLGKTRHSAVAKIKDFEMAQVIAGSRLGLPHGGYPGNSKLRQTLRALALSK